MISIINHQSSPSSKTLKRRMTTKATRGPPKRFAPLDPVKGNPHKAPPLKGVVFDVDGTLWYASSVSPLCPLFLLPNRYKKEEQQESSICCRLFVRCCVWRLTNLGGLKSVIFLIRIHGPSQKNGTKRNLHFCFDLQLIASHHPKVSQTHLFSQAPYYTYLKAHLHTAIMNSNSSSLKAKNDFIWPL